MLSIINTRTMFTNSGMVIKSYLSLVELCAAFVDKKTSAEYIHRSIICLYLSKLLVKRDAKTEPSCLGIYYGLLSKVFFNDVIIFDNQFLSNQIIKDNFSIEQFGYVIDIIHQYYLANMNSDKTALVDFTGKSGYRKMRGAYYTPYEIARLIVVKTIDELEFNKIEKPKIFDMGCGTGVFLSALAHELALRNHSNSKILEEMIFGSDIEFLSVTITKIILQIELGIPIQNFNNLKTIKTEDILFQDIGKILIGCEKNVNLFDAVVMNPPYDRLKVDGGTDSERSLIARKIQFVKECPEFKNSASGSIDLYRLFIDKSLSLLKPKGILGAIIPMSFIADRSASALRKFLINANSVSEIIIFPEKARLFENVTQACSIIIINSGREFHSIKITQMNTREFKGPENIIPIDVIKSLSLSHFPIPLISSTEIPILKKFDTFPRIRDINEIKNRRGELDLTLDKQYLSGSDAKLLKGISVGLFSYNKIFSVDYESFIRAKSSSLRVNDIHSDRIAGQQISNISSVQRLKFSLIPKGYILGNSLNYFTVSAKLFNKNSFNLYSLLGFLNSHILNWRFKLTSSNNHVNNYELDDLPIPIDAPRSKIESLNQVVLKICENNLSDIDKAALLSKMNIIVYDCFDLPNCFEQ